MPNKVWDEITYPFPSLKRCTVEVWEWICNFIPHFIMDVISCPCWWWQWKLTSLQTHNNTLADNERYCIQYSNENIYIYISFEQSTTHILYSSWNTESLQLTFWRTFRIGYMSLQWRHNGRDGVSNHQPHDCLLNRLFRRRSKKTSKLRVTGLCAGNSPHKWPITRKMFPFDDVIMYTTSLLVRLPLIWKWFVLAGVHH